MTYTRTYTITIERRDTGERREFWNVIAKSREAATRHSDHLLRTCGYARAWRSVEANLINVRPSR